MRGSPAIGPFDSVVFPELHAALGFGLLLAFLRWVPAHWLVLAFALTEIILLGKETIFDPLTEGPSQPFLWQGAQDLAWYQVGFLIVAALVWVPRWL